jgi:hypothetical protein
VVRQLEIQKFDDYLVQVKEQVKKCDFGELEDSLVKNMIVLRTRSNSVRNLSFTEKGLELIKAVFICRSTKRACEQVQEMTTGLRDEVMNGYGRRFGQN